ncbi:MAG: hypothetical protein SR1Q7_02280 [Quinella sp. 1Q7]|nr:hypothetical protein [Quinella sp. 1Q7]
MRRRILRKLGWKFLAASNSAQARLEIFSGGKFGATCNEFFSAASAIYGGKNFLNKRQD